MSDKPVHQGTANLTPVRTEAEARELGSKGGKKSVAARRKQKAFRELLTTILNKPLTAEQIKALRLIGAIPDGMTDKDIAALTAKTAIAQKMVAGTLKGDFNDTLKGFAAIQEAIGEKPKDKVEFTGDKPFVVNITVVDKTVK